MAKKKKKKKTPTPKPVEPEKKVEEPIEIVEAPFTCSFVGKRVDTRSGYVGVVTEQRWVESIGMLLLDFENGFTCNSQIVRVIEEG